MKDKHLVSKKLRVNLPSGKITMLTFQRLALHSDNVIFMKEMLYAVRCLKSNEDMILALAGQF